MLVSELYQFLHRSVMWLGNLVLKQGGLRIKFPTSHINLEQEKTLFKKPSVYISVTIYCMFIYVYVNSMQLHFDARSYESRCNYYCILLQEQDEIRQFILCTAILTVSIEEYLVSFTFMWKNEDFN